MKKLKRSTGETQLLSKLRCSLLYSLSTFCCTCFRACCKGHAKVKYESFAQKLKILMFEYQKTGNVSLTQNPGGCREHNDLQRRFDSTNMKKWYRCAKPAAPSSTGQKSYELCPEDFKLLRFRDGLHLSFSDIVSRRFYDQTIIEYPCPHTKTSAKRLWMLMLSSGIHLTLWRCEHSRRRVLQQRCCICSWCIFFGG